MGTTHDCVETKSEEMVEEDICFREEANRGKGVGEGTERPIDRPNVQTRAQRRTGFVVWCHWNEHSLDSRRRKLNNEKICSPSFDDACDLQSCKSLSLRHDPLLTRGHDRPKKQPEEVKDVEAAEPAADEDPNAPKVSQNVLVAQRRMQQTQAQVNEVTEIMRVNVEKVLERDAMISQLDERADALKEGAEMFEKQAGALKSKFWWKNAKMIIVMVIVGVVFAAVVFMWFSK